MSHLEITLNGSAPSREGVFNVNEYIAIGRGQADAYSNSPATALTAGSVLCFYDNQPINNINGATISTSSGWVDSVTLPAGVYVVDSSWGGVFSSSGVLVYGAHIGNTGYFSFGSCGASANHEAGASISSALIDISTASTISINIHTATNLDSITNQGSTPALESWLLIRRLVKV